MVGSEASLFTSEATPWNRTHSLSSDKAAVAKIRLVPEKFPPPKTSSTSVALTELPELPSPPNTMASQNLKLMPDKLSALNPLAAIFKSKVDGSLAHGPKTRAMKPLGKPLTEFHPFPRLPGEIRAKIWKLGMPGDGRIVELKYSKKIYHPVSPTPAPVLLHVCREVRLLCSFMIRVGLSGF